jgi:hypothetical protein
MPKLSLASVQSKLSSSQGFKTTRLTPDKTTRSKKVFSTERKTTTKARDSHGGLSSVREVKTINPTSKAQKLAFKNECVAWCTQQEYKKIAKKAISAFLAVHQKYKDTVDWKNAYYWIHNMKFDQSNKYHLLDSELDEVIDHVLLKRSPLGEFGQGPEKVTDKTIIELIQNKYKQKMNERSKIDSTAYQFEPLSKRTINRYMTYVKNTKRIDFFANTRKKLRRRLHLEQDLRSILSQIAMLDHLMRLPETDPLYNITNGRVPFELVFNIDSTTFIFDPDLQKMREGTWDAVGTEDHQITKDAERTPFGIKSTVITNGTGNKRYFVTLKVPQQYVSGNFQTMSIPGRPNCVVVVTNGKFDLGYFEQQVRNGFV